MYHYVRYYYNVSVTALNSCRSQVLKIIPEKNYAASPLKGYGMYMAVWMWVISYSQ